MVTTTPPARPVIACAPLYPPVELIHAAGYHPLILWDLGHLVPATTSSDDHLQSFCCSVARRMTEYLLSPESGEVAAFLYMNACDTIRNLPEILAVGLQERARTLPMIRFHLPAARLDGANGRRYLADEIDRVQEELGNIAKEPVSASRFRESVALYGRRQKTMLALEEQVLRGVLSFTAYCDLARQANRLPVEQALPLLEAALAKPAARQADTAKTGIVLSGILPPPPELSCILEDAGLRVCANDIASLRRSISHVPETYTGPADYYQQFYARHFPCPTLLHTADRRYETLLHLVRSSDAAAVVFIGEKFCEAEFFEIPYLSKRLHEVGIATLTLEFSMDGISMGAQKTRVEALAELLVQS